MQAALLFLAVASTFQYTWSIPKIMLDHDIRHDNNGDGTKREQDEEMKAFSTSMRSMLLGSILLSVVAAFIPDFYHLPPSGVPNNRKSSKKKSS